MEAYKFPNKSVFNTFSQHTKERRRSGFEDFLKLVMGFDPLPPEMEDFLELEDHLTGSAKDRSPMRPAPFESPNLSGDTASRKRPQPAEKKSSSSSSSSSSKAAQTHSATIPGGGDYIPSSMLHGSSSFESSTSKLQTAAKIQLRNILLTTFLATTIVYAACVYCGLIDVSQSSNGKDSILCV